MSRVNRLAYLAALLAPVLLTSACTTSSTLSLGDRPAGLTKVSPGLQVVGSFRVRVKAADTMVGQKSNFATDILGFGKTIYRYPVKEPIEQGFQDALAGLFSEPFQDVPSAFTVDVKVRKSKLKTSSEDARYELDLLTSIREPGNKILFSKSVKANTGGAFNGQTVPRCVWEPIYGCVDQFMDFAEQDPGLVDYVREPPLKVPQPLPPQKLSAAMFNLQAAGTDAGTVAQVRQKLAEDLGRSGWFTLVDRNNMQRIMAEQGLAMAGGTAEQRVEAGKILGVRWIIDGQVARVGAFTTVSIWCIDVETTEEVLRVSAKTQRAGSNSLNRATRNATNRLLSQIRDI